MLLYMSDKSKWSGEAIDGIRYPINIANVWTTAEINAVGLAPVVGSYSPPPGMRGVTKLPTLTLTDGVFYRTWEFEAIPAETPEELEVRKEKVMYKQRNVLKLLFIQHNQIRVLQNKQPHTALQFRDWAKGEYE